MFSFFATSRFSGLVSIATELNSAKFRQGLKPSSCKISGGASSPSAPAYCTPMIISRAVCKIFTMSLVGFDTMNFFVVSVIVTSDRLMA